MFQLVILLPLNIPSGSLYTPLFYVVFPAVLRLGSSMFQLVRLQFINMPIALVRLDNVSACELSVPS